MCFRPSTASFSVTCPACGRKVNEVLGNIPDECPFCEECLTEAKKAMAAGTPMGAPAAPGAPEVPSTPRMPDAPVAPGAPKAPSALSFPGGPRTS